MGWKLFLSYVKIYKDSKLIKSVQDLNKDDTFVVNYLDGQILSKTLEIKHKNKG